MSFTIRAVLTLTAVAGTCLAGAGCGSSSTDPLANMSAKQVAAKAIGDLKSAPRFTVAGAGPSDGSTVSIDLGIKDGKDCTGTVADGSQGSVAIIVIGSTVWMKPDATFWQTQGGSEGSAIGKLLAGKYLQTTTSVSGASSIADICNVNSLTSQMSIPTDVAKGTVTTVSGQEALELTDKAKDSTMYVTDTAAPQILKVVSTQKGNSGQFTITYGVPTTVTAPPASSTVNGAKYGF